MGNGTARARWRWLVAGLVGLSLVAAACGDDDDDSGASPATTAAGGADASATTVAAGGDTATTAAGATAASSDKPKLAIVYSAEWKDGSWGEAALDGANELKAKGLVSDVALQENVQPGADAERALRAFAEDGYNPIVAHSFNYGDDVKKVAKDFPDTLFVYAGGFGDVAANVSDYSQPFYQAAYLEGILAAGVVKGAKVAGAGGFDIPVCQAMYQAYLAGAQVVDPTTSGSFVAIGDWYDVQKAKEAALGQASGGAKMFIGCGQGPTFGQIEAAKEVQGVATGYVGDMASLGDVVMSSTIWKLDKVFELMVADVAAGKVNPSRYFEVDLKDGGMDIAVNPVWQSKIPADVMKTYQEKLAAIQAGTFEVPFKGTA
jgi:basic membrane lipoprotein Med (substrate-binding protein (PBP1-ABC) superfamily)